MYHTTRSILNSREGASYSYHANSFLSVVSFRFACFSVLVAIELIEGLLIDRDSEDNSLFLLMSEFASRFLQS